MNSGIQNAGIEGVSNTAVSDPEVYIEGRSGNIYSCCYGLTINLPKDQSFVSYTSSFFNINTSIPSKNLQDERYPFITKEKNVNSDLGFQMHVIICSQTP